MNFWRTQSAGAAVSIYTRQSQKQFSRPDKRAIGWAVPGVRGCWPNIGILSNRPVPVYNIRSVVSRLMAFWTTDI